MLMASEAKAQGLDVMRLMDVLDGIGRVSAMGEVEDVEEYVEFINQMAPVVAKVVPVREERRRNKKRMTLKNRQMDGGQIYDDEVLLILVCQDMEREIARRVGDIVVDHEVTQEDLEQRVVWMFVEDDQDWEEEPQRI